jgi:hypothetical protein
MRRPPATSFDPDWDQILRPKEVEQETGLSWASHRRAKAESVIQLGIRAVGMTRRDAHRPITRKSEATT